MITAHRLYGLGLALELVILMLLLAGCMKEPDYKQDFGPEISWSSIATEVLKTEGQAPGYTAARQGQFVYSETVQKIEDLPATVVGQQSYTLRSITDDETEPTKYMVWNIVKEVGLLQANGHMKVSSTEDTFRLEKPKDEGQDAASTELTSKIPHAGTSAAPYFHVWEAGSPDEDESPAPAPTGNRISYHNLHIENIAIPIPPLVLRRPDCGGLSDEACSQPLQATKISFDQVEWIDGKGYKVAVIWTFAKGIPFLATVRNYDEKMWLRGLISDCIETVTTYQNQQLNIIQCHDIKDFTFGSN